MSRRSPDRQLDALASAFKCAIESLQSVGGNQTAPEPVKAFLAALMRLHGPSGKRKRGRPVEHDKAWAIDQLFALAATIDGVPDGQTPVLIWLEDRFRDAGRETPSITWLKGIEKEFREKSEIRTSEMRLKYQTSPVLQRTWATEPDYLEFCALREKMARKWLHSEDLRKAYRTPGDYFMAIVTDQFEDRESSPIY